ncbi:MAG: hypothetical protein EB121_03210, partial [Alphaproteobacteria bacterium]|nr:hypothetical protein [Alphaproteobacteria bacterium]
ATASAGVFTAAFNGADFSAILNLVREFGTTRILSAPRLTVMNNQTAILKVARNEVYFTTSAQFPTATNNNGVTVAGNPVFSSTPRTVPVGLVMTVQPAVNGESEEVTLNLRPTISRIVSRVEDPSIGLNANAQGRTATVQSLIPVLAVRELDSVLRVRSGEVAIMGGLMQDSSNSSASGIPGADETPLLSYLTGSKNENNAVSELVILLRATIVDSAMPDQADRALYRRYTRDPRAVMGTPKGKKNR